MNFLAHLWLADVTATSPSGAMLGDMVRGQLSPELPPALALGIRIHRRVDAVTDRHPLSLGWRSRFPDGARRYAGIVLDLLCDHALALDWSDHVDEPLAAFAARAAQTIVADSPWFERYAGWKPRCREFDALLQSYAEWAGFQRAVTRTATRLRHPQGLIDASRISADLLPDVRDDLSDLLGDLRAAAEALQAADASRCSASS